MKKLCTFLLLALLCIFVAASMLSCNEGDASPSTGGTPPTQQGGTEGGGTQGGGTQGGGTQGGGTQGGGTQGGDAQKLNFEGVVLTVPHMIMTARKRRFKFRVPRFLRAPV